MPDDVKVELAERQEEGLERMNQNRPSDMLYGLEETPPWYLCILLGFQHYLTMVGATIAVPLVLAPALCIGDDANGQLAKSEILSTLFFVSGFITLLQTTIGSRLPIIQGATAALLTPTFAILALPKWQCPKPTTVDPCASLLTNTTDTTDIWNQPDATTDPTVAIDSTEIWQSRMREVQGAIIVSSLFEVFIGLSGAVGFLVKCIGPISIAPTISLVGLALLGVTADFCARHWWIAIMTIAFLILFSQCLRGVELPCLKLPHGRGSPIRGFPLFKLFPVILAITLSWFVCAVLTWTDVLPDNPCQWGYHARTDIRKGVIDNAKWFRIPYPFQWGMPTFSLAAVFGMLAGVIAGMMESIGDYYACARLAGAPPPPAHAINRGLFIEGIGSVMAGLFGTGNGTTSYSENVGAIGITKVASRRVIQVGATVMIVQGLFVKFGALVVSIPDPVVGGMFVVMFGMITAVGISNVQFVDLNSTRNLFVIGFSIFFGLFLPQWVINNPGQVTVGVPELDHILTVLLSTSMFVGGVVAFFLDNTLPGTPEERGITKWCDATSAGGGSGVASLRVYDLPFGMRLLRRQSWARYFPICPTFHLKQTPTTGDDEFNPIVLGLDSSRRRTQ